MNLLETQNFIINWLKEYAKKYSINNFVIGVSGGVDSALTSTLCAKTKITTTIVSMPIHQRQKELKNANLHSNWLIKKYNNVKKETIDLSILFEEYKKIIPTKFQCNLSLANSRARIRMTTLYQIAGNKNGLVVGTGNKIEDFGIGFFTKYGDGGVDISPIADLTKSEVKKLAIFCGVNQKIVEQPPTDGLWEDGRTDEDQIGTTYKELEWAMNYDNKKPLSKNKEKILNIYKRLNAQNKHKMIAIPICKIPAKFRN